MSCFVQAYKQMNMNFENKKILISEGQRHR